MVGSSNQSVPEIPIEFSIRDFFSPSTGEITCWICERVFGHKPVTLWQFNIAIENDHLYWIFPLKMVIFHSFLYVYQRVPGMQPRVSFLWAILVVNGTTSAGDHLQPGLREVGQSQPCICHTLALHALTKGNRSCREYTEIKWLKFEKLFNGIINEING